MRRAAAFAIALSFFMQAQMAPLPLVPCHILRASPRVARPKAAEHGPAAVLVN